MKLKDFQQKIADLIANHPETAELDVFQTSCFDDPLRFETSGIYVGEAYEYDNEFFKSQEHAFDRALTCNDKSAEIVEHKVVIVEAY